jgi:hypothetical protein
LEALGAFEARGALVPFGALVLRAGVAPFGAFAPTAVFAVARLAAFFTPLDEAFRAPPARGPEAGFEAGFFVA